MFTSCRCIYHFDRTTSNCFLLYTDYLCHLIVMFIHLSTIYCQRYGHHTHKMNSIMYLQRHILFPEALNWHGREYHIFRPGDLFQTWRPAGSTPCLPPCSAMLPAAACDPPGASQSSGTGPSSPALWKKWRIGSGLIIHLPPFRIIQEHVHIIVDGMSSLHFEK